MNFCCHMIKIVRPYEAYKKKSDPTKTFGNVKATIIDNIGKGITARNKFNSNIFLTISENAAKYFAELRKDDIVIVVSKLAQTKSPSNVGGFYSLVPWYSVVVQSDTLKAGEQFMEEVVPF